MLAAGLAAVAAVVAGGAAAAPPIMVIPLHARLAPVSGTRPAGSFSGTLVGNGLEQPVHAPSAMPSNGERWRLRWKASFPSLGRPAAVTLRIAGRSGAPAIVRVLSTRCSTSARGTLTLSGTVAGRIARGDAVVTVRAGSARLRGAVKVRRSFGTS